MGVSGSGKSTVGSALAQRLRVRFVDADTLHPPAHIAKMTAGEPLNDDDRYPWLEKVGEWLADHRDGGVVSCSALKRNYRDRLRMCCPRVEFLHLSGSRAAILAMLARGCRVSASTKGTRNRCASAAPTIDLPDPETPITTTGDVVSTRGGCGSIPPNRHRCARPPY